DATAGDNIWSVTLDLVPDGGANTWEWGFNDLTGTWVPKNNTQFTVVDASPVTTTYEIKTGVDEFAQNAMKVYPNPTSGVINISGIDTKAVEIFNMYGAKVLSVDAKSNAIDVSGLSNGAYLVKAIDTNGEIKIGMFNKK
ncbi:MAG: T9SS type A sorting domain-containing protein, partial [Prolixibacteraceae bacterium]|nr:T9SS type A sorting domain-containing protein [Prolixibacteraceae bacterium]